MSRAHSPAAEQPDEATPDIFETLKSSVDTWAEPMLGTSYESDLVLHVLEKIKDKGWANPPRPDLEFNPKVIQRMTIDFCKVAIGLNAGTGANFTRIAQCLQFIVDNKLCDISSDAAVQRLAISLYKLSHEDFTLINATPAPLNNLQLRCLISMAQAQGWEHINIERTIECIKLIATYELCTADNEAEISSLALPLSQLSAINYAWLFAEAGARGSLNPRKLHRLIHEIKTENLWDIANRRSLELLHTRLNRRRLLIEVKRLYADTVKLTTEWGHGACYLFAPSGAKGVVKKVTERQIRLPDTYPLDADNTRKLDKEIDDVGRYLHEGAKTSLKRTQSEAKRADSTEALYQDIMSKLKPTDEDSSTALTTVGNKSTGGR